MRAEGGRVSSAGEWESEDSDAGSGGIFNLGIDDPLHGRLDAAGQIPAGVSFLCINYSVLYSSDNGRLYLCQSAMYQKSLGKWLEGIADTFLHTSP